MATPIYRVTARKSQDHAATTWAYLKAENAAEAMTKYQAEPSAAEFDEVVGVEVFSCGQDTD